MRLALVSNTGEVLHQQDVGELQAKVVEKISHSIWPLTSKWTVAQAVNKAFAQVVEEYKAEESIKV